LRSVIRRLPTPYTAVLYNSAPMNVAAGVPASTVIIRVLQTIEDLRKVEQVEQEVWGLVDRDITPIAESRLKASSIQGFSSNT
jgi:hypothetical protein